MQVLEYQQPTHSVHHGAREESCLIAYHRERALLYEPMYGAFHTRLKRTKVEKYLHTFSTGDCPLITTAASSLSPLP